MRVVLGCRELAGLDSLLMGRIVKHGFQCFLQHLFPRWPERTIHRQLPAGTTEQPHEGRLRAGLSPQLQQLRMGTAPP